MNSSPKPAEFPVAGNAATCPPAPRTDDPYQALDGLMAVIEATCPVWPERKGFVTQPGAMQL